MIFFLDRSEDIYPCLICINGVCQAGKNLTVLGVGKNYIGNNFKKGGYTRDKATGYYMKAITTVATNETTNTTNTTAVVKANKKVVKDKQGTNNTKSLEDRINSLEKQIQDHRQHLHLLRMHNHYEET